jgi:hypothetical protein
MRRLGSASPRLRAGRGSRDPAGRVDDRRRAAALSAPITWMPDCLDVVERQRAAGRLEGRGPDRPAG